MKKFVLITLFASAFFYEKSSAQSVQIKAGASLSDWRGDGVNALNSLVGLTGKYITRQPYLGYYGGAVLSIPISEALSIEPGVIYSKTGTSLKGDIGIKALDILRIGASANMIQQQLEFPLLLKATVGKGLKVIAGPQASYQLNSKLQVRATALGFNLLNRSIPLEGNFEPLNVAAVGGFEYDFENGLGIQATYQHGLTSMVKDRSAKVYSQSGRVGLTYKF